MDILLYFPHHAESWPKDGILVIEINIDNCTFYLDVQIKTVYNQKNKTKDFGTLCHIVVCCTIMTLLNKITLLFYVLRRTHARKHFDLETVTFLLCV